MKTTSDVSLNVKRGGNEVYSVKNMKPIPSGENARCPNHTFELAGGEPDEYELKIHGNDALGVDQFYLHDATNGGVIRSWGAGEGWGGEGWCFSTNGLAGCWSEISGAKFPILGVKLYKSGSDSSERIKFGGGTQCRGNQSCSSDRCVKGGGKCGIGKKCCSPVSSVLFHIFNNLVYIDGY